MIFIQQGNQLAFHLVLKKHQVMFPRIMSEVARLEKAKERFKQIAPLEADACILQGPLDKNGQPDLIAYVGEFVKFIKNKRPCSRATGY